MFIDVPNDEMLLWMTNVVKQITHEFNLTEQCTLQEEFHVSLTRTLVLKTHWIDSFAEAVKQIVEIYPSFLLELSEIKVYCNEDRSRTFMGITARTTKCYLERLTHNLNKLMEQYQLPPFYEVHNTLIFYNTHTHTYTHTIIIIIN